MDTVFASKSALSENEVVNPCYNKQDVITFSILVLALISFSIFIVYLSSVLAKSAKTLFPIWSVSPGFCSISKYSVPTGDHFLIPSFYIHSKTCLSCFLLTMSLTSTSLVASFTKIVTISKG